MLTRTPAAGISLPPLQGSTNCGAFSTAPLNNGYTQQQVKDTVWHRPGVRLAVNPPTVADEAAWAQTRNVVTWAQTRNVVTT